MVSILLFDPKVVSSAAMPSTLLNASESLTMVRMLHFGRKLVPTAALPSIPL